MFKNFRFLSVFIVCSFVFSLFPFSSQALAELNPVAFNPTPASEYTTGGAPYQVNVFYQVNGGEDVSLGILKLGVDLVPHVIETHHLVYGETYTFEWDGKINQKMASEGNYRLYILKANTVTPYLTHDFSVKDGNPQLLDKLSFETTPKSTLNVKKGELIDFSVKLSNFEQAVDVHFDIQPEGKNAFNVKTIQYTGNTTKLYQWDGEQFGDDLSPGEYTAIFYGDGIKPLTHTFNIVTAEPTIAFDGGPSTQHLLTGDDYKVSVALTGYASQTTVTVLTALGLDAIYIPQDEYVYKADGTHEFSWDVSDYDVGTYPVKIVGKDYNGNITNTLDYQLKIVEKAPMLSFVDVPPISYTVGQEYKASVQLADFTTDTSVDLFIYKKNTNPVAFAKAETYVYQAEGTHEFTWDGKLNGNQATPGDYEVRLLGQDLDGNSTNILTQDIQLLGKAVLIPGDDSCAGYKDLKKTDWSCAAAQWAKDAGIMTGQQGGEYFDGYSYLNRAEIAKVALVAHQLYKAENDYCQAKKPFADILLGQWYTNYICLGKNIKMLTGYAAGPDAGKYVPARSVTLPEMFCIVARPLGESMPQGASYSGLATDQWYSGCAKYVKDHGYFEATSILPTTEATRFNALNFLYALHQDGKI